MTRNTGLKMKALIATLLFMTACSTNWTAAGNRNRLWRCLRSGDCESGNACGYGESGNNISAADLNTIQNAGAQAGSDLQMIRSLITQYETASVSAQLRRCCCWQMQMAALNAVQSTLNGFLPALRIKDLATEAKITATTGILLSEVQSMVALVPLVTANESPAMMTQATRQIRKQPPLKADEFVKSYNAAITAKTGDADLDKAAAGLGIIHMHGTDLRAGRAVDC